MARTDPHRMRCLGCGKWTRRSRCSMCRAERKRALALATPGRLQRQAERQRKARGDR